MKVIFIGVGEACDTEHGNTSLLVTTAAGSTILLDCGFSVPHRYFGDCPPADELDMVWISHLHGDHFFGLPLLLLRFWEMGRRKPLQLLGQRDILPAIQQALELAYSGFAGKLGYSLEFIPVAPGIPRSVGGLEWHAASTIHSQENLGILLDDGRKKLYYSGDGRPTGQVVELIRGCDLVIHESYRLVDEIANHGSISGSLDLAHKAGAHNLAFIHLERGLRKKSARAINEILNRNPFAFLPDEGDEITL